MASSLLDGGASWWGLYEPLTGAMHAADGTLDDATIRYFRRHERRTYRAQLEAMEALSARLTYRGLLTRGC